MQTTLDTLSQETAIRRDDDLSGTLLGSARAHIAGLLDICRQYGDEGRQHLQSCLQAHRQELDLLHDLYAVARSVETVSAVSPLSEPPAGPSLAVYFLAPFQIIRNDVRQADWAQCKAKSIFKYLVAHHCHPVARDVLMEKFWPEADPISARNNLNVAIYKLRKVLSCGDGTPCVVQEGGNYHLSPDLPLWLDADEFMRHAEAARRHERAGRIEPALQECHAAEMLYQQPYLDEDRYEDWIIPVRQSMQLAHLETLDCLYRHAFQAGDYKSCITVCRRVLEVDPCNEVPHRQLMVCHARLGQVHLAMRQFHVCVDVLQRELRIAPGLETVELFRKIRNRQSI
ncbi:MAG: BTAD domain-containing putative transcriptional regulator [Leptothrix sp. (in: b-proteobacteria)]